MRALFQVRIHVILPGGREGNIGATPSADSRHADIAFALNDAFRRASRQLQDHARTIRGQVKTHEPSPVGKIKRFDANTGFGFIEAADGHEIYFDQNTVVQGQPFHIQPGLSASFVERIGEKGSQASTVRLLEKHTLRLRCLTQRKNDGHAPNLLGFLEGVPATALLWPGRAMPCAVRHERNDEARLIELREALK